MTDPAQIEERCLDEAKAALADRELLATKFAHHVDDVRLDGTYPHTLIVVTGRHTYGGDWTVRFPIWDPAAGGTKDGVAMPSFVGLLVYSEVIEA